MRILIQRVKSASVTIGGQLRSQIGAGLLVLLGVGADDTDEDVEYLAGKLVRLRIFDDAQGVMNLDVRQVGGQVLVVSQFTLLASTRKGNRPSYIKAAAEDWMVFGAGFTASSVPPGLARSKSLPLSASAVSRSNRSPNCCMARLRFSCLSSIAPCS